MIDLKRTKELLGDPKMLDAEAREIRDAFYSMSELIYEKWHDEQVFRRNEDKDIYEKRT